MRKVKQTNEHKSRIFSREGGVLKRILGIYTTSVILLLIYLPIFILIVFSFNNSKIPGLPWRGFTLKWYSEIGKNDVLVHSLINSILVAFIVTVFSLIIGVLAARAMTKFHYKLRSLFTGFVSIPFVMPWMLIGIALLLFFNLVKLKLSLFTVIISHISFDVPLVAVLVSSRLSKYDYSVEEASRDLGASPIETFFLVTLPIIAPSLIAAGIFAFSWSFDAFYITHFVSGSQVFFPTWVWSALRYPNKLPLINAVSSLVLVVELIVISVAEIIRVRDEGASETLFM